MARQRLAATAEMVEGLLQKISNGATLYLCITPFRPEGGYEQDPDSQGDTVNSIQEGPLFEIFQALTPVLGQLASVTICGREKVVGERKGGSVR